jgi:hypothetical protein
MQATAALGRMCRTPSQLIRCCASKRRSQGNLHFALESGVRAIVIFFEDEVNLELGTPH